MNAKQVHTESTLRVTDPKTGRLMPILNDTRSGPMKWFVSAPNIEAVRDLLASQVEKIIYDLRPPAPRRR